MKQKRYLIVINEDGTGGISQKLGKESPTALDTEALSLVAPGINAALQISIDNLKGEHEAAIDAEKETWKSKIEEVRADKQVIIDSKQETIDTKNLKIEELRTEKQEALAELRAEHQLYKDSLKEPQFKPVEYLTSPNGTKFTATDEGVLVAQ